MRNATDTVASLPPAPAGTPAQQQARARVEQRLQGWMQEPWRIDYFAAMRQLEALVE